MWQASPHAVDGESGNFEQGGFYGRTNGATTVDFGHADCGYGAAQVTTGMRKGDTVYTSAQQTAIAVDYAANISAGLQILQDKWNQTKQAGMIVNNGDPQYLENWWYALWAYNSGYHKRNDPTDPNSKPDVYGLGWSNNVTNEDYPADRGGFLDQTTPCTPEQQDPNGNCSDAKHPNSWSYPERVIGWARHSLLRYNYVDGKYQEAFARATWAHGPQIPRPGSFCTVTGNQCDITKIHKPANYPTDPGSHCQRDDLACYWHDSASWQDNYPELGTQVLKYLPRHRNARLHEELDKPGQPQLQLRRQQRRPLPIEDRLPPAGHRVRRSLLVRPHVDRFDRERDPPRHRHLDPQPCPRRVGPSSRLHPRTRRRSTQSDLSHRRQRQHLTDEDHH